MLLRAFVRTLVFTRTVSAITRVFKGVRIKAFKLISSSLSLLLLTSLNATK